MEIQRTRNIVQSIIALVLLYEGYQFYLFARHFETFGATPFVPRPPAVEAFLPISALVSLKSWMSLGIFDTVHPAGLAIFIAIMGTAFIFQRPFCSWLCPVGLFAEGFWKAGKRIFGENPRMPKAADHALMLIKYLILFFFLWAILVKMPGEATFAFANAPYNKVVDVKMLDFWIEPSSAVIKATVGILGRFAPARIKRHEDECINCSLCTKNCPGLIDVENCDTVTSVECIKCLTCIEKCPKPGALDLRVGRHEVAPLRFAAAFLAAFFLVIIIAKLTGHWHSSVTYEEYKQLIPMSHLFSH
jgi:polyferredoxin